MNLKVARELVFESNNKFYRLRVESRMTGEIHTNITVNETKGDIKYFRNSTPYTDTQIQTCSVITEFRQFYKSSILPPMMRKII